MLGRQKKKKKAKAYIEKNVVSKKSLVPWIQHRNVIEKNSTTMLFTRPTEQSLK